MKNLILFGLKGVGKTTFGKLLGNELSLDVIEIDDLILGHLKEYSSCFEAYQRLGEKKFREVETLVIETLKDVVNSIIALGGGSILREENRRALKGNFVYLKAKKDFLKERQKEPNFMGADFDVWVEERLPLYEKIPAFQINVDEMDERAVLSKLKDIYGQ